MKNAFVTCIIAISEDGAMHVRASRKGFVIEKRFPPAQALALKEWLQSPEAWANAEPDAFWHESAYSHTVAYSHETGDIIVDPEAHAKGFYKPTRFNASKDEDLAKLVRHLKRITPMPPEPEAPSLPDILPTPTAEQMANRTIFTAVATPDGVGRYAKPRPRYMRQALGAGESKKIVDDLISGLLIKGLK